MTAIKMASVRLSMLGKDQKGMGTCTLAGQVAGAHQAQAESPAPTHAYCACCALGWRWLVTGPWLHTSPFAAVFMRGPVAAPPVGPSQCGLGML